MIFYLLGRVWKRVMVYKNFGMKIDIVEFSNSKNVRKRVIIKLFFVGYFIFWIVLYFVGLFYGYN